jgi:hypothetical protein
LFQTRIYTDLHGFWGFIALIGVHAVRYVQAISHQVNLGNLWLMKMQADTTSRSLFPTRIYTDLRWFLRFIALIRVHVWNWWLIFCSTSVESVLQIGPLLFKTKPIFRKGQMSVKSYNTEGYENSGVCRLGRSKANSNPIRGPSKPIQSPFRNHARAAGAVGSAGAHVWTSARPFCAEIGEKTQKGLHWCGKML